MAYAYITFRSVTHGQRGERLLREAGLRCSLQRTPRWMEEQGCGYCLKLWLKQLPQARQLLDGGGVRYRRLYRVDDRGALREVEP